MRVYGTGGGVVKVSFRGETRTAQVGADGWCVELPADGLKGVAVVRSSDVCESANIHPRDKSRLARRLSRSWDCAKRPYPIYLIN